ncbi:MAG: APC family permease [Candidatus Hadarchaeum sp.]|uniref:APC family permease n=1 Tax=Candidatus Hadarchaeum sp. TaxID=2883567 RepID=UPI003180DD62
MKKGELAKELGVWEAFLLSVGGMIGAAIFVLGAQTGMIAGPSAILAWALAGLLMFIIALVLVEQATVFPRAGAIPAYAMETFGKSFAVRSFASFLGGWGSLIGQWFGVPFSAMYVGGYVVSIIPSLAGYETIITWLVLTFAFLLNISGISITGKANAALTALLLVLMLAFFFRGAPAVNLNNYSPFFATGGINFLKAIPIAALGFGAWLSILAAAEEIKNPEKTLPKAIGLSILVTTVFYLLILFPLYGTVNWQEFTPENPFAFWAPLSYAAVKFAPAESWVQLVISLAAILALITTVIALMLLASRVIYGMGKIGIFPSGCGYVWARRRTPAVALIIVYVVSMILGSNPDWVMAIIVIGTVMYAIGFLVGILSHIGLRINRKDIKAPFRVPGGIGFSIIAFVALALLLINVSTLEIWYSLLAVVVGIVYFVIRYASRTGVFAKKPS